MTKTIAVLDEGGYLIGTKRAKPKASDVVLPDDCDLATDGRYRWDGERFQPPGHGYERVVTAPPVSMDAVVYMIVRKMQGALPAEAKLWADWYEANLKRRDDEISRARRRKSAR